MAQENHTPGPWAWFGNASSNSLYLATTHSGRRYVMGFKRWGMWGGQPQFQPGKAGLIDASELLQFEVGDQSIVGVDAARKDGSVYRYDVRGIDCADARLIAASPELLEVAKALVAMVEHNMEGLTHKETGPFIPGVTDLEIRPDGSLRLSDARAAIAKAEGRS